MRMRGHSLVWPRFLPPWLQDGHVSAAQVEDVLREHIETLVGHYRGRVQAWDVVNEAYGWDGRPISALMAAGRVAATSNERNVWFDPGTGVPGIGYIDTAFRLARTADAGARLFYNDYGLEKPGPKFDAVYAMASRLRRDGAPIDGIGIQMHAALSEYYDCVRQPQPVPPFDLSTFAANLEALASLGLEVEITELDVRIPLPANAALRDAQAELYGAIVAVCMRQPRCTAVQLWGFSDRHSWLPQFQHRYPGEGEAHPFDADYAAKPAVAAIRAAMLANARR
jgi:endo-1,4-beta-xylanase